MCRETNRSARASLAKSVRSAGEGFWCRPRVRKTCAPAAASRPSMREARSKTRSASVVSPCGEAGLQAAVAGVDDDAPADQVRAAVDEGGALAQQLRAAAGDLPAELAQRAQGGRAAGAVGGEPVVALEGAQAHLGLRAEDAVGPAGVVAELEQPLLQARDVVAAHRPLGVVAQQPVTERPARLRQRPVGLLPTRPSTERPRTCWKWRTATSVAASNSADSRSPSVIGTSSGSRPRMRSETWTSATAGPRSPSRRGCMLSVPIVSPIVVPDPPSGPSGSPGRADGPVPPAGRSGPAASVRAWCGRPR